MNQAEILQQFKQLDRSSPQFPDQLTNLLHKKEYKECILDLRDEDVVWLVNYLDEVCLHFAPVLPHSFLNVHRFSNLSKSTLPVPRSEDAYVSSAGSAVPDNGCPGRTHSRLLFPSLVVTQSLLGALAMSMKAP